MPAAQARLHVRASSSAPDDSALARGGDGVVYLGGELPCLADGVGGVELAGQDQAPILAASELVQARKDLRHVLAQRFDVAIVLVELARHPDQPDGESGVGFVALSIAPHVQENWPVSIGHERFHFSRGEAQPGPAVFHLVVLDLRQGLAQSDPHGRDASGLDQVVAQLAVLLDE